MAVTKRTRYEVLRRDNYTCRYCHSTTNDLTIDHVIPRALGGKDDPSNLVAACRDCNAGKTSTRPDDHLVDDVSSQAFSVAQAIRIALMQKAVDIEAEQDHADELATYWDEATAGMSWTHRPDDWQRTIIHFQKIGVPDTILTHAIDVAVGRDNVPQRDKWKYMCGVIWRIVDEAAETATPKAEERKRCGHCIACLHQDDDVYVGRCDVYGPFDEDDEPGACPTCGRVDCLFWRGQDEGIQDGMQYEFSRYYEAIVHYRTCEAVVRHEQP